MIYKYLSDNDYSVIGYSINKYNNYSSSDISSFSIEILSGTLDNFNTTFNVDLEETNSNGLYKRLVYDSTRKLYYETESNHVGYIHRIDTKSVPYIKRKLHDKIKVISIPHLIFGEKIVQNSFKLTLYTDKQYTIIDDGNYNLYDINDSSSFASGLLPQVGNIFYESGIVVLTSTGSYSGSDTGSYIDSINNFTLEFSGSHKIYEMEVICNILESEFNYTTNPTSMISESSSLYIPLFSHSGSFIGTSSYGQEPTTMSYSELDFRPYISGIGLYNHNDDLLAIAKFPRPIKKENYLDQAFIIKLDL